MASPIDFGDMDHLDFEELLWSDDAGNDADFNLDTLLSEPLFAAKDLSTTPSPDHSGLQTPPKRIAANGIDSSLEVLIYETHRRTQRQLERLLSALRCRTIVADSYKKTLQYACSGVQFDIIMIGDQDSMVERDAMARDIRAASQFHSQPPLVSVTALSDDISANEFDSVVELPLSKERLADMIDTFFDRADPFTLDKDGPESDCSWTESDDQDEWQFAFKRHLREFRAQDDRISLICPPLSSQQRRKIHAMAHLYRLSHTSLGHGKYKRVLLVKCQIQKPSRYLKHWNPARSQWIDGTVDPRIITVTGLTCRPSLEVIKAACVHAGLPAPTLVSLESKNSGEEHLLHAFFDDPADAAMALEGLHGTNPVWNCSVVTCDYTIFHECTWSPWHTPANFEDILTERLSPGDIKRESKEARRPKLEWRSSSPSMLSDDTISESEFSDVHTYARSSIRSTTNPSSASVFTNATSRHSNQNESLNTGYASATSNCSNGSHIPADYASDVSSCKRKRMPFVSEGYECSFGCGKSFGHAGDRRKHEKIHEDRSHMCEICGKAFLYAKDVRRHCKNVHSQETYLAQRAEADRVVRRFYG